MFTVIRPSYKGNLPDTLLAHQSYIAFHMVLADQSKRTIIKRMVTACGYNFYEGLATIGC